MDINLTQPEEEHLAAMMAKISEEIKQNGGHLAFSRYMHIALYEPNLGYYSSDIEKFGVAGDFITAPEISPFFGQTIVNTILPVLEALKQQGLPTRVLEFGAGTGSLAKSILLELHLRGFVLDEYQIPCERICMHRNIWHRLDIAVDTDSSPASLVSTIGAALSQAELNKIPPVLLNTEAFADGYTTEVHLQVQAWLRSLTEQLTCGLLLIIDYGFHEQEYYHPQRQSGTLMAHHRHRALTDVLQFPGISDITNHIECSSLLRILEESIHGELFFSSQASYLLDAGITELVLQKSDPHDIEHFLPISNALQKLISEAEMGELFKVIAFGKNLETLNLQLNQLPGFAGRNRFY